MFYDLSHKKVLTIFFLFAVLSMGVFIALSVKMALGPRFVAKQVAEAKVSLAAAAYQSIFDGTNRLYALANVYSIVGRNGLIENHAAKDRAKSIPVLVYHGVLDDPDGVNILLKDFKAQLFALKKSGWQTITLE